jgi:hypothetical protein
VVYHLEVAEGDMGKVIGRKAASRTRCAACSRSPRRATARASASKSETDLHPGLKAGA